jgi:hypothetical protein
MNEDLWAPSPLTRLKAARALRPEELKQIQDSLSVGCPVEPWPYGNATVINPLLVTLGISPGGSPEAGDEGPKTAGGHPFPTAGVPHPGTRYQDSKSYWDRVRHLAKTTLSFDGASDDDALALFGNLNLDPGRSGDSRSVKLQSHFASWVLHTIRNGLRPRFLIMLGLTGHLEKERQTAEAFSRCFPGFDIKKPRRTIRLNAYRDKAFFFREWDFADERRGTLTLVAWPQHPSRAPFTASGMWEASCHEFAERHKLPHSLS